MNPVELLARLRAAENALSSLISETSKAALAFAVQVRAERMRTDYGTVSVSQRKPSIVVDEKGLLDWARENAPAEVVESVRKSFADAFRKQLLIEDGSVVYALTGEEIDFATIKPAGDPYLTVKLSDEAKEQTATLAAASWAHFLDEQHLEQSKAVEA